LKRVKRAPPPPSPPSPSADESGSESEASTDTEDLPDQRAPRFCKRDGCNRRFTNKTPRVLFTPCGHTVYCSDCAEALWAAAVRPHDPLCPICEQPLELYYEVDFHPSDQGVPSEYTSSLPPSSSPSLVLSQADTIHADQADSEDFHGST
jgi:hypothetical protein